MALLTNDQRRKIRNKLLRKWSIDRVDVNFMKNGLYNTTTNDGAIADIDGWLDSYSTVVTAPDTTGMRGALTVPFRNNATNKQINEILSAVSLARISMIELNKWLSQED